MTSKMLIAIHALLFVGCAHVNSVSLTPIPANRAKTVQAEVQKTIFLGFNFDNDFVDGLTPELKRQCPNGVISGILTKDETISYVLVFNRRVSATGFCNASVGNRTKSSRSSASAEKL